MVDYSTYVCLLVAAFSSTYSINLALGTLSLIMPNTNNAGNDEEAGGFKSWVKGTRKASVRRDAVIYPENPHIRKWDALMLIVIFLYAFIIPYSLGVSGGIHLLLSIPWFVIVVIMNTCFFIDTFLHFFRAYRDTSGRMVIDPKTIRRNYLKSLFIPNLLSNLPTTILFFCYGRTRLLSDPNNIVLNDGTTNLVQLLKVCDVLKLLRLRRAQNLLKTSEFVREFREKRKAFTIRMWAFVFYIVLAVHWFACTWSFVAFVQVGNFRPEDLLTKDNWIGYWYNNTYTEGGLNPLGWENDTNRYALSIFWAVQTITSIGYGNIAPFTPAEWWVGSFLQLMAGIMWAYIIGGLVSVVTAMEVKNELFRDRIDSANDLISLFLPEERASHRDRWCSKVIEEDPSLFERKRMAKRIRRYIYTQSERETSTLRYASSFEEAFPVLETLSPELKRSSILMVVRKFIERVPYLSSRYLSFHEQSLVAQECLFVEFPCGEPFRMEQGISEYGRGIIIQVKGLFWRSSTRLLPSAPVLSGDVVGGSTVLLEDDHPGSEEHFRAISFSSAMFIPREAVLSALSRNPSCWKECARWRYFGAALVSKAIDELDGG